MTLAIAGAGLAGLLAGNMLARRRPVLFELQPELPNNHSAVLRFRSSVVGDVLSIPFKKVTMIKASLPWKNPVTDALAYSFKNTGVYRSDRSIISGLTTDDRFIAPPDLIARAAQGLDIRLNSPAEFNGSQIISTLPMPTLMAALDYPYRSDIIFEGRSALNIRATLQDCDAYVSLLVPDPAAPFSRISITGNELIVECTSSTSELESELIVAAALTKAGLFSMQWSNVSVHKSRYAKILPIDEVARRDFLYWATDKHNVFSLGRYATWRPGLLLDDLVKDVRLIDGWLDSNRYAVARHR